MPDMGEPTTREAILDLAQNLAQTRGFHGFSFRDLAEPIGIRAASIHHHFPSKADLGRELMVRYRKRFREDLDAIAAGEGSSRQKLERFVDLFLATLRQGNRLCLCGMLATEFATLPEPLQREVQEFYRETESWLASTLESGRRAGELAFSGSPVAAASLFFSSLEGAMIAARAFHDEERLAAAARWLLTSMTASDPARRSTS
jgi:TetR/AcrR family transcriptional regulator, transcriptional repressor for nem operon